MGGAYSAAFVAAFRDLFVSQRECHPDRAGVPVPEVVSDALVLEHLEGRRRLGIYCVAGPERDRCRWAVADVQLPDWELAASIARKLAVAYGLVAHVEKSKGRGWRVWLFFTAFVPCWKARAALRLAIADLTRQGRVLHPIEVVPDKDQLPAEVVDVHGRFVWLPMFGGDIADGRTCFYRDDGGSPVRVEPWAPGTVAVNHEVALDQLLDGYERNGEETAYARGEDEAPGEWRPDELMPCAQRMLKDGVRGEATAERAKRLAVHLRRNGMPLDVALPFLGGWNQRLCVPPLPDAALEASVRAGYDKKEGLGCALPEIVPVCARAECSVWHHCNLGGANGKAASAPDPRGFMAVDEKEVPPGEYHFVRGPMRYFVLNLDNSKGSLTCKLVVHKDGKFAWADRCNLDSSLSRIRVARQVVERCAGDAGLSSADVAADLLNVDAGVAQKLKEAADKRRQAEDRARQGYVMDDEKIARAERWADAHPRILYDMVELTSRLGLIREKKNRILVFLIGISRRMKKPCSGIGKGDPASGKSHLAASIFKLLPEEDLVEYTRITGGALYYRGEHSLQYRVFFVREAPGSEGSEHSLRTFMTEDDLRISTVEKDETGHLATKDMVVRGPVAFYTTTTQVDINPENETRLIQVNADETEATTWAILHPIAYKAQNGGLEADEAEILAWRNYQRILPKGIEVLVPFAGRLIKDFPIASLRARRDFERLLALIKACAYAHYRHRQKVQLGVDAAGQKVMALVASVADYAIVKQIVEQSMMRSAYDVKAGQENLLEAVRALTNSMTYAAEHNEKVPDDCIGCELLKDETGTTVWIGTPAIRKYLGKTQEGVRNLVRALEEQGLLVIAPNRKPIRVRLGDSAKDGDLTLPTIAPDLLFADAPHERALYYDPLQAPDFDEVYKMEVPR